MKGAGVQYLIVIEMVVRMEKECKNTNEEENMKKNVKKVISFILSMLVIISTAVTPVSRVIQIFGKLAVLRVHMEVTKH